MVMRDGDVSPELEQGVGSIIIFSCFSSLFFIVQHQSQEVGKPESLTSSFLLVYAVEIFNLLAFFQPQYINRLGDSQRQK